MHNIMTPCTPEYLVQESGIWSGSQEDWETLLALAINYLDQNPLATPNDFADYLIVNFT